MHISKEWSAQNSWNGALHMYKLRRYSPAPLDLGFHHPVDSGQADWPVPSGWWCLSATAGVGHLGWNHGRT
jgi:hypothetical protein